MERNFGCVLLYLLCISPLSFGQKIVVRVIDARSGRPLQKQKVTMSFSL